MSLLKTIIVDGIARLLVMQLPVLSLLCLVGLPLSAIGESSTTPETLLASSENSAVEVVEGDILQWRASGRRSLALLGSAPTWVDGIVPYRIDSALPEASVTAINSAIAKWNQLSEISLIPVAEVLASNPSLSAAHMDSVAFLSGEGCASWVGRRGGEQEIWISPSCTTGSVMHEIGHVLGLEHEHTRPDRDQFITIHWDNIAPEKKHNFDIASSRSRPVGEYDYGSIMHYGPYNFAIGNATTITPIFGPASSIGQRISPSQGDLAAVAELYATDLAVTTQFYKIEGGAEASIQVTNNLDQGAHDIEVDVSLDFSQLVAHSDNGWRCRDEVAGMITCNLDRLAAASRSRLLLRFREDTQAPSVRAEVRSKTPDLQILNNSDSSSVLPALAAAQLQDDAQTLRFGGAISPWWLMLGLLLLQGQTRCRINGQAGNRIKYRFSR